MHTRSTGDRQGAKEFLAFRLLPRSRTAVLLGACFLIAVIAAIDWRFEDDISFGFLYLFPMLMAGSCLKRVPIAGVAILCTGLTEAFDPFPWAMPVGLSRLVLTFVAFFGAGLYGFLAAQSRRWADEQVREMEGEAEKRRLAEEQMDFLISNSPASIFTLDATGTVQLANEAAHRLLSIAPGQLQGQTIGQFFPALASVPTAQEAPFFHTEMECRARRHNGEVFLAHIWFSTYQTQSGPRLAAVVFDTSEELRDRAEFNREQILAGSKILVSAFCHEVRNMCGAINAVHSKLARHQRWVQNGDFDALQTLVQGLERMTGWELRQTRQPAAESLDVRSVLEELRIVIDPSFQDSEIPIRWNVPDHLPRVWADRQALLQAFLNLAKNSHRALEGQPRKEIIVRASVEDHSVAIRWIDSGPGVAQPEQLFTPFQLGAQEVGLGLYLSRSFVRAFQGDLHYESPAHGSCFVITLALATNEYAGEGEQP